MKGSVPRAKGRAAISGRGGVGTARPDASGPDAPIGHRPCQRAATVLRLFLGRRGEQRLRQPGRNRRTGAA